MRVIKDAMAMMRERRITGNIYKLLGSIIMGDVAYVKTDNGATKGTHVWVISINVG